MTSLINKLIYIYHLDIKSLVSNDAIMSRRITVVQDLFVQCQFSLVQDNRTNVNVYPCMSYIFHCNMTYSDVFVCLFDGA